MAFLKEIGIYQQTFYVITKNNSKKNPERTITLEYL